MRVFWPVLAAVISTVLMGCGASSTGGGSGGVGVPDPRSAPTYQVSDSDCPQGWTGLTVTTATEAEVEYLDDMPACTDSSASATYLKNNTDAVWTLKATSTSGGLWTPNSVTLGEASFVAAVREEYPGRAIFVPGAEGTVNLPPGQVEWDIDLPLSFGWQGHELVLEKVESAGEAAVVAALKRQSPAGAALAVCTLGVTKFAKDLSELEDANTSDVLLSGLGATASASACRFESAAVATIDEAGRPATLADDLAHLGSQATVLENAHVRLDYAQKAWKAISLGLKFFRRGG